MSKQSGKFVRCALLFAPVVIVVGSFVASLPWLKQQGDSLLMAASAAAAIFVMGYSAYIAHRFQRGLDEVQIANQEFATSRGWLWGAMGAVVLLMLPPVPNWLIDVANSLSTGSPETTDRTAMRVALYLGLMLVVLVQLAALIVASAIWQRRMGGPQEQ